MEKDTTTQHQQHLQNNQSKKQKNYKAKHSIQVLDKISDDEGSQVISSNSQNDKEQNKEQETVKQNNQNLIKIQNQNQNEKQTDTQKKEEKISTSLKIEINKQFDEEKRKKYQMAEHMKRINQIQQKEWNNNECQSDQDFQEENEVKNLEEQQIEKIQIKNENDEVHFEFLNEKQITAIYTDEDLKNIMKNNQSTSNSILNQGFIEESKNFNAPPKIIYVDSKILLILYLLYRKQVYRLSPPYKRNWIDLHPANKNKIKIFADNKQQVETITKKISQIIKKISVIKLNIKQEQANKMKVSRVLSQQLLDRKRIIFKDSTLQQKAYYYGGQSSQSELTVQFKQIRNYRFKYFRIFDFPNTRSYKLIISRIIKNKILLKSLSHWKVVYLELLKYIPNPYHLGHHKQMEKSLCFLMTITGYMDNVSPKEIEIFIQNFIKENFFCFTFVIKRSKSLKYPKLTVEDVEFVYLNEKRFNKSYIYIICSKEKFFEKKQAIIEQLEKLNERNRIYGARFFKNISPEFKNYKKPEYYRTFPFPDFKPYSYVIVPKLDKDTLIEKKQENIKQIIQKIQSQKQIIQRIQNEEQIVEKKEIIFEKKEKKFRFYDFNWKELFKQF